MKKNGFRMLRRWAALGLVLALLAVSGAATFAGQDDPAAKTAPPAEGSGMDFTYDRAVADVDAAGNKFMEFYKDDVLIRREVYYPDRVEVFVADGAGGLVRDPAQCEVFPTPEPPPYDQVDKYLADDGRTVCDYMKDGVVTRREVYAEWGSLEVYVADENGALVLDPVLSKVVPSPAETVDQEAPFDDARKYQDGEDTTVCEYLKGGAVVRREVYRPDRLDVYVLDADGTLVWSEAESQVFPTPEPPWFDDARKYQDAANDTIVDYFWKGVLVKREVYLAAGGLEVYLPDDAGNLVRQPAA